MTQQAGFPGLLRILNIVMEIIQHSRIHIKIVQIIISKRLFRFLVLIENKEVVSL